MRMPILHVIKTIQEEEVMADLALEIARGIEVIVLLGQEANDEPLVKRTLVQTAVNHHCVNILKLARGNRSGEQSNKRFLL